MKRKNIYLGIIIIVVCLGLGIAIGCTLKNNFDKNSNSNNANLNNNQSNNDISSTRNLKVTFDNCGDYEATFNGINIKLETSQLDDMMCNVSKILINDVDLTNDNSSVVDSLEIYGKYVIIASGDTSSTLLTIYDTNNKETIYSLDSEELDNYFFESYDMSDEKIIINTELCGEQCGDEAYYLSCDEIAIKKSQIFPKAKYEIKYENGTFRELKLVEKKSFADPELSKLYDKYYSKCK